MQIFTNTLNQEPMSKVKELNFDGQTIFCGLDVQLTTLVGTPMPATSRGQSPPATYILLNLTALI